MKRTVLFAFLLVVGLACASDAFAEEPRRGCWGRADRYNRLYNPDTVVTLSGTVTELDYFTPGEGMAQGVHLLVREPDGEVSEIHLGPRWYLENQDVVISEGDMIEVTGSRITFEGEPVIIASTVRMDGEVLRLRDRQGYPLWAGWRQERY